MIIARDENYDYQISYTNKTSMSNLNTLFTEYVDTSKYDKWLVELMKSLLSVDVKVEEE
jgi:hypothetical protein